jgi:bla regulator protein BlaR1
MTTDSLLHWLQRTSLEASLLILAVLGLRLMLGTRLSPAWRIGLWMLVGAKLMLPAFIPAGFGLGGWLQSEEAFQMTSSMVGTSSAHPSESDFATDSGKPQMAMIESIGGFPESAAILSGSVFLLGIWLIGTLTVLAVALLRQRRFHQHLSRFPTADDPHLCCRLAHLSSQARVPTPQILLTAPGTTPALVGVRQPCILLPSDWQTRFTDRSLRHVLLHELHHISHHDLLWNWAATAVQALHWFNPLVWFVVSRFQADRELRCDAGALAILSPTERLDYGHTLLRIQETFFAPPAIAGLAPCVRHHPTLRQRILMITHPTTRQPWLHALLVLTLSVLVCYSFTTARAQEKVVPAKVREGETIKKPGASNTSEKSDKKPAMKDGEREGGKPSAEREGGSKKPGMRDGEGGVKKPGTGDGEGTKKTGSRDGEGGKPSAEREGGTKKPGMKDGEKPRTGERDGEKPRTGSRDGEGGTKTGARDGEGSTKTRKGEGDSASVKSSEVITMHVTANGDTVLINGEKQPISGLRGHLSTFLPDHPGAKVIVSGDPDTPLKSLHEIVDAVRDNGNKNVGIKAE